MYKLIDLPYKYDALEPYMDAQTVEIHYAKHHQGYVNKFNAVIKLYPELQSKSVEDLLSEINTIDVDIKDKVAIINNGSGVANHNLFWQTMSNNKEIDDGLIYDAYAKILDEDENKNSLEDKEYINYLIDNDIDVDLIIEEF